VGLNTPVRLYWTAPLTAGELADVKANVAIFEGADASVCAGGTPVANISVKRNQVDDPAVPGDNVGLATTQLIMEVSALPGAAMAPARWQPSTFYRVQIQAGTTVTTKQGGPAGEIPDDFELCFRTPAAT
jgi:hypothetical protein